MSIEAIQRYHAKVEKIIQYGGSRNESSVRFAFQNLLESYCAETHLELIAELDYKTRFGNTVRPDGTLKDALRQDWGYWESKDQYDDLSAEIAAKFEKGYPKTNILFEDGQTAVLIQDGEETGRASFADAHALHTLLTAFVHYEPPRVQSFREAIEKFKEDLPALLEMLRETIEAQAEANATFRQGRDTFLELCQKSINPYLVMADVREMIIQHILTEDIFITIFEDAQFHRENNIARELYRVTGTFYKGELRHNIERRIDGYVKAIKAAAAEIVNHHEKQRFLKAVYENFYKAYNPAGADRLGIVYTPDEIVHFMIEATDHLVYKHFGRFLADQDVDILDPATGTGTFITELIEHLPKHSLPYKYEHEIHCNEVAILPYYIANLNIEYTYGQKMGRYKEFTNICFVDTLDNLGFGYAGKQYGFFLDFSAENLERIQRQNQRKISVIIGNPPYNANQLNENENNKNREYPGVDKRIKETYIRASTAQKTKMYDMYTRFLRWASDRLAKDGVIAFITNRSFLEARSFDGFRKVVADEFSDIYVVDLGGDVRKNPKLSGTTHNVFGIQTGVAISFFVKDAARVGMPCRIHYVRRPEMETAREKLRFLATTPFEQLPFEHIQPDTRYTWLGQDEHEWEDLIPIILKRRKSERADCIFTISSPGVVTARDEWIVDISPIRLSQMMQFLTEYYNNHVNDKGEFDVTIKWSRNLKRRYEQGLNESFDKNRIRRYSYRPFTLHFIYDSDLFIDEKGATDEVFKSDNLAVAFTNPASSKPFSTLVSWNPVDFHLNGDTQYLSRYRYDEHGTRHDNITDWAVEQFAEHYHLAPAPELRDQIFAYVYAVLHDPAYRQKYEINLKREFPRIPFYDDFAQWAAWGRQLLDLHLNYETVEPYPLQRVDSEYDPDHPPKSKLKADKETGEIIVDTITTLAGIPPEAWEYRLGNRTAIEWVMEYHKESTPRDPTIREKFNTYRLADYKEQVIDLLSRVVAVSVETVKIVRAMGGGR